MLMELTYRGMELVVFQEGSTWWAGFKKNPQIVRAATREEAVAAMKKEVDGLSPVVLHTYERHGEVIRALEDL
jgi:hypothetical protein